MRCQKKSINFRRGKIGDLFLELSVTKWKLDDYIGVPRLPFRIRDPERETVSRIPEPVATRGNVDAIAITIVEDKSISIIRFSRYSTYRPYNFTLLLTHRRTVVSVELKDEPPLLDEKTIPSSPYMELYTRLPLAKRLRIIIGAEA